MKNFLVWAWQNWIPGLSWQFTASRNRWNDRRGCRCIRALLAQEGWSVSRKQVQRVRRKEGLKGPSQTPAHTAPRDIDRLTHSGERAQIGVDLGFYLWSDRQRRHLENDEDMDEYSRQSLAIQVRTVGHRCSGPRRVASGHDSVWGARIYPQWHWPRVHRH